jgi:hypothetical protein
MGMVSPWLFLTDGSGWVLSYNLTIESQEVAHNKKPLHSVLTDGEQPSMT